MTKRPSVVVVALATVALTVGIAATGSSASAVQNGQIAWKSFARGRAGLHTFSNPAEEPAQLLAISAGSFPDVVAYPEAGYAWVATRNPDPEQLARGGDPGIIARFEIPIE